VATDKPAKKGSRRGAEIAEDEGGMVVLIKWFFTSRFLGGTGTQFQYHSSLFKTVQRRGAGTWRCRKRRPCRFLSLLLNTLIADAMHPPVSSRPQRSLRLCVSPFRSSHRQPKRQVRASTSGTSVDDLPSRKTHHRRPTGCRMTSPRRIRPPCSFKLMQTSAGSPARICPSQSCNSCLPGTMRRGPVQIGPRKYKLCLKATMEAIMATYLPDHHLRLLAMWIPLIASPLVLTPRAVVADGNTAPRGVVVSDNAEGESERFFLGPYSLGNLYAVDTCSRIGDIGGKGKGPAERGVIHALNMCQIYIVDRRIRKNNGQWKFGFAEDDAPGLLIAGKLQHELKDSKGRRFLIQITELDRTTFTEGHPREDDFELSWREVRFEICLHIESEMLSEAWPKGVPIHLEFKKPSATYFADGSPKNE